MKIAVLYNDDRGLAHGTAEDRFAAEGVLAQVRAVVEAIASGGHAVFEVPVERDVRRWLGAIQDGGAELVFNCAEAVAGESRLESAVAATLELAGVPYTGAPPLALAIALDKPTAKVLLRERGVPMAEGCVLADPGAPMPALPYPCIVKPAREDASHGISSKSVVRSEAEARAQARWLIGQYRQPAVIERFVDGRELNVSIVGEGDDAEVLSLAEIDFSKMAAGRPRLVTYDAKWVEGSPDYQGTPVIPLGPIDAALRARVEEVALLAYRTIGLRDYGRVDMRLDPGEGPIVLEVNPNPDISPDAGLARAAARSGMEYEQLIARIVRSAARRALPASR